MTLLQLVKFGRREVAQHRLHRLVARWHIIVSDPDWLRFNRASNRGKERLGVSRCQDLVQVLHLKPFASREIQLCIRPIMFTARVTLAYIRCWAVQSRCVNHLVLKRDILR